MSLIERLRKLDETGYGPLTGAIGEEAAHELERLGDIVQKQGGLILMQEQELISLRGPLAPLPSNEQGERPPRQAAQDNQRRLFRRSFRPDC